MSIDASIPLRGEQFRLGDIMEQAQQMRFRQAQMDEYERKRQQQARLSELLPGAMNGDQAALNGVAGVDPDTFFKIKSHLSSLDKAEREREVAKWTAAGPTLARMKTIPYEQRRTFLQASAPALIANGWTPQELQSFDPSDQAIDALGTTAMTVAQVRDSQQLNWHPIGERGSFATDNLGNPVGEGNPFAGQTAPAAQTKTIGGKTYYNVGGKWHDSPPEGGAGLGQSGFRP